MFVSYYYLLLLLPLVLSDDSTIPGILSIVKRNKSHTLKSSDQFHKTIVNIPVYYCNLLSITLLRFANCDNHFHNLKLSVQLNTALRVFLGADLLEDKINYGMVLLMQTYIQDEKDGIYENVESFTKRHFTYFNKLHNSIIRRYFERFWTDNYANHACQKIRQLLFQVGAFTFLTFEADSQSLQSVRLLVDLTNELDYICQIEPIVESRFKKTVDALLGTPKAYHRFLTNFLLGIHLAGVETIDSTKFLWSNILAFFELIFGVEICAKIMYNSASRSLFEQMKYTNPQIRELQQQVEFIYDTHHHQAKAVNFLSNFHQLKILLQEFIDAELSQTFYADEEGRLEYLELVKMKARFSLIILEPFFVMDLKNDKQLTNAEPLCNTDSSSKKNNWRLVLFALLGSSIGIFASFFLGNNEVPLHVSTIAKLADDSNVFQHIAKNNSNNNNTIGNVNLSSWILRLVYVSLLMSLLILIAIILTIAIRQMKTNRKQITYKRTKKSDEKGTLSR